MFRELIAKTRAFLVGAKVTIANSDFWGAGSNDFETNVQQERGVLADRAESMWINSPEMFSIDSAMADDVIGRGIRLQIEEPYQKAWDKWSKKCDMTDRLYLEDMQRLVYLSSLRAGEIYTYVRYTSKGLKLQLLEASQICDYKGKNGVEVNKDGSIKGYYFYMDEYKTQVQFIKKRYIIHFYESLSASQYRGISDYNRGVTTAKNLMGFDEDTLAGARLRAGIGYVVQNGKHKPLANPLGVQKQAQDLRKPIKSIGGLTVQYLNEDETIKTVEASPNGTNYKEFTDRADSKLCLARRVSTAYGKRDYRGMSFSSHKAEKMQNDRRFDVEATRVIRYWLEKVYEHFREYMFLTGQLDSREVTYNWITPHRDSVQPDKEITTIGKKLDRDLTNPFDVCKSMGTDYEDNLTKQKEAIELQKKIYGADYDDMKARELELEKYEMKLRYKEKKIRKKDDKKAKKKSKKTATKTA